jgi:hypothetical protein
MSTLELNNDKANGKDFDPKLLEPWGFMPMARIRKHSFLTVLGSLLFRP